MKKRKRLHENSLHVSQCKDNERDGMNSRENAWRSYQKAPCLALRVGNTLFHVLLWEKKTCSMCSLFSYHALSFMMRLLKLVVNLEWNERLFFFRLWETHVCPVSDSFSKSFSLWFPSLPLNFLHSFLSLSCSSSLWDTNDELKRFLFIMIVLLHHQRKDRRVTDEEESHDCFCLHEAFSGDARRMMIEPFFSILTQTVKSLSTFHYS